MKDIMGNEIYPGDKVFLIKSPYKNLENKIYTVMQPNRYDPIDKVKISISDQWQGYYKFNEIIKVK